MLSSDKFVPLRKHNSSYQSGSQRAVNHTVTSILQVDALRNKFGIEVEGEDIPAPIQYFSQIGLPSKCLTYFEEKKNFRKLTPIQMQGISCLLNGRDCVCLSSTGSGKTYGYLLPLCNLLRKRNMAPHSNCAPFCLIIVPTRELMNQVLNVTKELIDLFIPNHHASTALNLAVPQYTHNSIRSCNQDWDPRCNSGGYTYVPTNPNFSYRQNILGHNQQFNSSYQSEYCSLNFHTVVGLCGGVPVQENLSQLSAQTKILVATPGRLLDLCDRGHLSLRSINYFVIDECDRMLDMGLEESLRKIVAMVTVQDTAVLTSLWSATLPSSLERLARSAVVNPVFICTGIKDTVPRNITQNVKFLHTYLKPKTLLEVLRQTPYPPVLVFTGSKQKADEIAEFLQHEQFHAAAIHSDKDQRYRNEVMKAFRSDELDVLVATDLISRGLDMPAVTHVINFDSPDSIEDYVHRCGRTGRFGRPGITTTFLTLRCKIAEELRHILESTGNDIPPELYDVKMFGKDVVTTDMGDRIK